ncbi:MAG: 50S ribosomal protein L17 [Dehalococcoidia bacterium]|nr:50S ribosomal protein L17 [Dehalococcoidia bacterium]
MLRSLMGALLRHEQIKTTDARAKELRRHMEKLITTARRGVQSDDQSRLVHARRLCMSRLPDREAVDKLFTMLTPEDDDESGRFDDRPGGYTRITPLYRRLGDNAHIVQIEFVE